MYKTKFLLISVLFSLTIQNFTFSQNQNRTKDFFIEAGFSALDFTRTGFSGDFHTNILFSPDVSLGIILSGKTDLFVQKLYFGKSSDNGTHTYKHNSYNFGAEFKIFTGENYSAALRGGVSFNIIDEHITWPSQYLGYSNKLLTGLFTGVKYERNIFGNFTAAGLIDFLYLPRDSKYGTINHGGFNLVLCVRYYIDVF